MENGLFLTSTCVFKRVKEEKIGRTTWIADIFVTELADQLQKLKVEQVLLHYLSQLKVLQGKASFEAKL
ncbi:hypothetical protein KY285_032261 [Solanum tuberosum]|nr:hypothetical protein KY289_032394 [Solanum tuberosum]KAH0647013.1 hypothetical protein KY285_032261 [Solanum tuberosum]